MKLRISLSAATAIALAGCSHTGCTETQKPSQTKDIFIPPQESEDRIEILPETYQLPEQQPVEENNFASRLGIPKELQPVFAGATIAFGQSMTFGNGENESKIAEMQSHIIVRDLECNLLESLFEEHKSELAEEFDAESLGLPTGQNSMTYIETQAKQLFVTGELKFESVFDKSLLAEGDSFNLGAPEIPPEVMEELQKQPNMRTSLTITCKDGTFGLET